MIKQENGNRTEFGMPGLYMNNKKQTEYRRTEQEPNGLHADYDKYNKVDSSADQSGQRLMTLDDFTEILPSAFAVFSLEKDRTIRSVYVSPQGNAIFGGTHEDYVENYQGQILSEWPFGFSEREISKTAMIDLLQGKAIEVTVPAVRVDGTQIWLRAFCRMKSGEQKQIIYASFLDITDQIDREKIRKRQDDRYRLLACTAGTYICDYDVKRDEFTCVYRNQDNKLTEKVIRDGMDAMIHSGSWIGSGSESTFEAGIKAALVRPGEGFFEFQSADRAEGLEKNCWYYVQYTSESDYSGKVVRIVGRVENIQDKKDREKDRYQRERAFRTVINSDAVLSLCFDSLTGKRVVLEDDVCPPSIPDNINLTGFYMLAQLIAYPEDLAEVRSFESISKAAENGGQTDLIIRRECRLRSLNDPEEGYRWKQFSFMYAGDPYSGHGNLYVLVNDIQERKLTELERLKEAALDPLTGLYKRHTFRKKGLEICSRRDETDKVRCAVYLNLDSFRQFNEEKGLYFGDRLLVQTARTLRVLVKEQELCARRDGDTFYMLLEGETGCAVFKERLRAVQAALSVESESGVSISCSIGASCAPAESADFDRLFDQAQQALCAAKQKDGSRCVFYKDIADSLTQPENGAEEKTEQVLPETSLASVQPLPGVCCHRVVIRTFGYFDVFVDGKAIPFKHAKAKELLALLADRRGGTINSSEAITFLWENESANRVTQSRYRKTAMQLKETLEAFGIADIIENVKGVRRIVPENVECDLYQFLSGGEEAPLFCGSYLLNYSWGETTLLTLQKMLEDRAS